MMKFYHGKKHDMWLKGCIPLGQFVCEIGNKLDLGMWLNPHTGSPSFAIVYGPEGHQYISGLLEIYHSNQSHKEDYFDETVKRYNEYCGDV
tara:strand:- start:14 stop:286 length:273 start_codon:yes stop_codon:yes gene_type:complete